MVHVETFSCSVVSSAFEIDAVNGVWERSVSASRESIAGEGAGGAAQAPGPVGRGTSRTSISERKAGEEESLDITQDGAEAPIW